ncbi:MAG: cobalamin-dependent protein [Fidelibacterota bacterium]|nr:MAG: cobalamin-dependent protein [Candidatus Neomarinimicrobiota bacterium]
MAKPGPKYISSPEAARILGVNVSSIKRWTDCGELACIRTAGGHRKFLLKHLVEFAHDHQKVAQQANLLPLDTPGDREISYYTQKGDYSFLVPWVQARALEGEYGQVQCVLLSLYLTQHELHEIYDLLITPVLHSIGELWAEGTITIVEEHLVSQRLKDGLIRLQEIVHLPERTNQRALCLNLSEELHDIPLKMVQHLLEEKGYQVYFSGQKTPVNQIEKVFTTFKPDRVYISSVYSDDPERDQTELDHIFNVCKETGATVFVGGRGFDTLNYRHPAVRCRLDNFADVASS